jgi:hypothetical protein
LELLGRIERYGLDPRHSSIFTSNLDVQSL